MARYRGPRYPRWAFFINGEEFTAQCKYCRRVANRKDNLATCPKKCEVREMQAKADEAIRRGAKEPKTLSLLEPLADEPRKLQGF